MAQSDLPYIAAAKLESPTDRYGHRVLGGRGEHGMMAVFIMIAMFDDKGTGMVRVEHVRLPKERVFEDVDARVADVDGDGKPEIIVVESSTTGGAQLAVYALQADGSVSKIASTPHIGRRNRWLAVAGIADFNGDGQNDIAYVETPHIGGSLRLWTLRDGELVQIASKSGFSNHRIGEDFITGGVRDCGNGTALVVPNFDWSRLMTISLRRGEIVDRPIGAATTQDAVQEALACGD